MNNEAVAVTLLISELRYCLPGILHCKSYHFQQNNKRILIIELSIIE